MVRLALIGTGSMGRKYAMMVVEGGVSHMKLTAAVCRSRGARDWAAENLPPETAVFGSAEELYGHPELFDAVLIVTSHDSHAELAAKAFQLGKHVFCDKPAGICLGEARQMNREAEKAGVVYGMMFHQRLYARYRKVKEILDSGRLGKIFRISMENTEAYRTNAYHKSSPWHSTWKGEGGGVLINQAHHLLDIWQWLFGMPREVYADIKFGKYNDFTVDDESRILMKYDGDVSGSFFVTTGEIIKEERLEIAGSRGTLIMDGDSLRLAIYDRDSLEYGASALCNTREQMEICWEGGRYPVVKGYEDMLENFALAVLEGKPLIAPGAEGERAMELANAAYLSAWRNCPVTLPVDEEEYQKELEKHIKADRKFGQA